MSSIIKVDQIQTVAGGAPTAADLGLNVSGNVVAVYNAYSNTDQVINTAGLVNITDLSITMTPKSSDNLIVMQAAIASSVGYVSTYTFLKDGAKTAPRTGGSQAIDETHSTIYYGFSQNSTSYMSSVPIIHYETAGSTTSRTYTVAATSTWSGTGYTLRINNRGNDMASVSYFTIWEIAG